MKRHVYKGIGLLVAIVMIATFAASALAATPAPASELVQGFVKETDTEFGYEVLRPEGWESIHLGDRRGYFPAELAGEPDRIVIGVTNFQTLASRSADDSALIVPWLLFRDNPSMEAWMHARERSWKAHGLTVERLRITPNAAIHVAKPAADQIQLVGHVIDKGQPLGISLDGYGAFSDYEKLEEERLITAFETMLASLAALDYTTAAGNVEQAQSRSSNDGQPQPLDHTTVVKDHAEWKGDWHCHGNTCGQDYYGYLLIRWRPLDWFPYWIEVQRMYSAFWYRHHDVFTKWLFGAYVGDDFNYHCNYGDGYVNRSIGAQTSPSTGWATDDWYPYISHGDIGAQTYYLIVFGDLLSIECVGHQPFE